MKKIDFPLILLTAGAVLGFFGFFMAFATASFMFKEGARQSLADEILMFTLVGAVILMIAFCAPLLIREVVRFVGNSHTSQ